MSFHEHQKVLHHPSNQVLAYRHSHQEVCFGIPKARESIGMLRVSCFSAWSSNLFQFYQILDIRNHNFIGDSVQLKIILQLFLLAWRDHNVNRTIDSDLCPEVIVFPDCSQGL